MATVSGDKGSQRLSHSTKADLQELRFMIVLAMLIASSAQNVEPQRCLLAVDGRTLVRGQCDVFPMGGGSFTLNTGMAGHPVGHFAVVTVSGPDRADASWNAHAGDLHAWDSLGPVSRKGACWINTRTRICAWK